MNEPEREEGPGIRGNDRSHSSQEENHDITENQETGTV